MFSFLQQGSKTVKNHFIVFDSSAGNNCKLTHIVQRFSFVDRKSCKLRRQGSWPRFAFSPERIFACNLFSWHFAANSFITFVRVDGLNQLEESGVWISGWLLRDCWNCHRSKHYCLDCGRQLHRLTHFNGCHIAAILTPALLIPYDFLDCLSSDLGSGIETCLVRIIRTRTWGTVLCL
jgi:hypothetical protein